MDNTLLFAYCITDGELDNMTGMQKSSIIRVVKNWRKRINPPRAIEKTLKKYQNNEGGQNNRKVSK